MGRERTGRRPRGRAPRLIDKDPRGEESSERGGDIDDDFALDFPIRFARDLAARMPAKTPRLEQLDTVHDFIAGAGKEELNKVAAELGKLGIDWAAPPDGAPSDGRYASPARLVAVVLPPPTRSVAPIPTLAMPEGVDRVRFELQLEAHDFQSYRVGLQDPETRQMLWRSDWIVPRASADPVSVSVLVPAKLLRPGHHSLELTGRDTRGSAEAIGIYTVRIVRP